MMSRLVRWPLGGYRPEARFGHYLMMMGALGEGDCTATSRQYGEYENSIGTGQVHLWFDRPADGFPPPRRTPTDPDYVRQTSGPDLPAPADHEEKMSTRETRCILLDGNVVDVVRHGETLVAGDGREVAISDATHLAPVMPSKIVCVHLNYLSRVER